MKRENVITVDVSLANPHPAFTTKDFQVSDVDSVPRRNILHHHLVPTKIQYFIDLFQSKFAVRTTPDIDSRCDRLKMVGINAVSYTTKVIELQSVWNRSLNQRVEIAVGVSTASKVYLVPRHKRIACRLIDVAYPNPTRRFISSILQYKGIGKFFGMSIDVVSRLASLVSVSLIPPSGDSCYLSATALAKPITHTSCASSTTIALAGV
jgi:hypothetical protein